MTHRSIVLLTVLAVTGSAAADPAVWNRLQLHHEALQRTREIRPDYVMGWLQLCERVAGQTDRPTADVARQVREVCAAAAQRYVQLCVEPPQRHAVCKPADGPALSTGLASLGPLSTGERTLLAAIPAKVWYQIETGEERGGKTSPRGFDIDHMTETCIAAAAALAPPPPVKYRELARDLCVRAAQSHAEQCIGAGAGQARPCKSSWARWEQVRDAARALATLAPAQDEVFTRILGSAELVEWREQRAFAALMTDYAEKKLDRCAVITALRARLGPPVDLPAAAETTDRRPDAALTTGPESRRRRYAKEALRMYEVARRTLDQDVERVTPVMAAETVAGFECVKDYRDAAAMLPYARALEADVTAYQAEEAKCAASKTCLAGRAAEEICTAMKNRRDTQADIEREFRYGREAGVVSLKRLGDNKFALEQIDQEIATKRAEYLELTGKPFGGSCKAPRGNWKKKLPIKPLPETSL